MTPEKFHQQQIADHEKNIAGYWEAKNKAFKDAIAPYVKQKAEIYNCCTGIKVIINDNGSIKHEYGFNEAQKINLRLIDELIRNKQREIFDD